MGNSKRGVAKPKASDASAEVYLVLGGNGFIGSHIVDKLVENKKTVKVLDSFRHEPQFKQPDKVRRIKGNAFDPIKLGKALKGVTHVIYSVAAANPYEADTNPYADIENLRNGLEILENCVLAGVKKVGFISSGGAVYGRLAESKDAHEQDVPLPVSPYGICKLTMEHYLEYFNRKYGLDYIIYRLSNPYGPRQAFKNKQGVVPAFLKQILDQEEITIYGDGAASRDYIYVEDAAQMIADTMIGSTKHHLYNVGSGQQTTLNEIIQTIEQILNQKAHINFAEAPATTLQKTGISVDRFRKEFGVPNLVSFDEGLKRTIKHFSASSILPQPLKSQPVE